MKGKDWFYVVCLLAFVLILFRPWNQIQAQESVEDATQKEESVEETTQMQESTEDTGQDAEEKIEPDDEPEPVKQGLVINEDGSRFYYKNGKRLKNTWKKEN